MESCTATNGKKEAVRSLAQKSARPFKKCRWTASVSNTTTKANSSVVAKDPLKNPALLQSFLDRHLNLGDVLEREEFILEQLKNNSAELIPLENASQQLAKTQLALDAVETKLLAAKEGKLQELAELQGKIGAEKLLAKSLENVATAYDEGLSFRNAKRDYDSLLISVGTLSADPQCANAFQNAKDTVLAANAWIDDQNHSFNMHLKTFALTLRHALEPIPLRHSQWNETISTKTSQLQAQGLSGGIAQLNKLMEQRGTHVEMIAKLSAQQPTLLEVRDRRDQLLAELNAVRDELSQRRKSQLQMINQSFKETIDDYSIFLYYDSTGICSEFIAKILEAMQGTFFQQKSAESLCQATTPAALAQYVASGDVASVAALPGVGTEWAKQLVQQLGSLNLLHALQSTAKPPCPRIRVLTKTTPQTEIRVNQLSDGQKHTILLSIAMLAESNDPLIIDQPEDDLDNAFVFKSVVKTLRYIKERRQVIVVTHNANMALLHESSRARTMPTDRILTGRCDTTLVGRGRSSDSRSHSQGRPHSPARLGSGREGHRR